MANKIEITQQQLDSGPKTVTGYPDYSYWNMQVANLQKKAPSFSVESKTPAVKNNSENILR